MIITELIGNSKIIETVQLLHSSLDVNIIINHFYSALTQHLNFNSIHYKNPDSFYEYDIGVENSHSYDYNLSVDDLDLGQIVITKNIAFTNYEILLFEEYLCLLVSPLKNAILHEQALKAALHDPMTSLLNRSSFDETLSREITLAKRHSRNLSIMAVDLDDFKSINDNYGQLTGDLVISEFAKQLKNTIRNSDIAFRLGGEEFLVILCQTDSNGAYSLAERLRALIETTPVITEKTIIHYTISIGISSLSINDDSQQLIDTTDQALYQAKAQGKNQVQIHSQ